MTSTRRTGYCQKHYGKIKSLLFALAISPLANLLYDYTQANLGMDPLDRMTRLSGEMSLLLLLLTLTITPLRHFTTWLMVRIHAYYGKRLSDWNWIIKLRRMIGLFSFFYAMLHLAIYFWLDQGGSIEHSVRDITERPFLAVGMLALVLLLLLAVTAHDKMMRLLGKNWRRLHRTVYLIAILSLLHFWMLSKVGVYDAASYTLAAIVLLGWRAWFYWWPKTGKVKDDGMETPERKPLAERRVKSDRRKESKPVLYDRRSGSDRRSNPIDLINHDTTKA